MIHHQVAVGPIDHADAGSHESRQSQGVSALLKEPGCESMAEADDINPLNPGSLVAAHQRLAVAAG